MCLSIHPCICPSLCSSSHPSIYPAIHEFIWTWTCLAIFRSSDPCVHRSFHLPVYCRSFLYLATHLSIYLSICLCIHRSSCPSNLVTLGWQACNELQMLPSDHVQWITAAAAPSCGQKKHTRWPAINSDCCSPFVPSDTATTFYGWRILGFNDFKTK